MTDVSRFVAGVVLCCILGAGCSTQHRTIELDSQHPAVRMSVQGVLFGDRYVKPTEVAKILDDYDIPHDRVIHIRLDPDVKDLKPARFLMACLARAGYTRAIFVTERHAEALNLGKSKKKSATAASSAAKPAARRVIRYKRASE